jgi:hypothetical protein
MNSKRSPAIAWAIADGQADNEPVTVRTLRASAPGSHRIPDCERLTLPGGAEAIRAIVPVEMLELEKVVLEAAVAPALEGDPRVARVHPRPFARDDRGCS